MAGRFELNTAISPNVGQFVVRFFGVLRDAIPDDWGRHVASKLHGNRIKGLFDCLWLPTVDRMGALAFGHTPESAVDETPPLRWENVRNPLYLEAIQEVHFRLSPAFDLVPKPSATYRRHLSLAAGEYGSLAIRENLLSRAEVFQLTRQGADEVIDEVRETVRARWRRCLADREVGIGD